MPTPKTYTVLLAGGDEANMIRIWLSPDGREYVIDSVVQLEVGGDVCAHPEAQPNQLVCDAPSIARLRSQRRREATTGSASPRRSRCR